MDKPSWRCPIGRRWESHRWGLGIRLWRGERSCGWRRSIWLRKAWIRWRSRLWCLLVVRGLNTDRDWSIATTTGAASILLSCQFGRLVFSKSFLQFGRGFEFRFLGRVGARRTWSRVARGGASLSFGLMEYLQDAHIVLLYNIFWDSLHTKNLNIQTGSIWQGVLDRG